MTNLIRLAIAVSLLSVLAAHPPVAARADLLFAQQVSQRPGQTPVTLPNGNQAGRGNPYVPSRSSKPGTSSPWGSQTQPVVRPAAAGGSEEKQFTVSQENIDAMVKKVNEATDIDEEIRKELLERLKGAADWLKTAKDAEAKTKEYQAEIERAPGDLESNKAALAVPAGEPSFDVGLEATSTEIELQATDAESRLKTAQETLTKLEESLKRRGERKAELTKLIAEMDQRLEEATKQLVTASGEGSLIEATRHQENRARCFALAMQKALYPIELKRIDATTELLPLRRDLAKREVAFLEKEFAGWQKIVADARKSESDRQAAEARRQVQNAHPALKSFAEENAKLAERRQDLVAVIEEMEKEIQQSEQLAQQLKDNFTKMSEKVDKAGESTATGFLLRRQRDQIPDVSASRERLSFIKQETPKVHLSALDLQDARDSLGDLDTELANVMAQLDAEIVRRDQQRITLMVADLLQTRRDVLDDLISDHDQYINLLSELELSQTALLDECTRLVAYIDEHVLWIRSSEPLSQADFSNALAGLNSLASPSKWNGVLNSIRARAAEHVWLVLLSIVVCTCLLLGRSRLRNQINRLREKEETVLADRFLPTVQAIIAIALTAAFWPALMWLVGWQLATLRGMTDLGRACGVGLMSAAFAFWSARFLGQLCKRNGVAELHFEWDAQGLDIVRKHLAWLGLLGLPAVFFVAALTVYDDGHWTSSLGRIAFLTGCLLLVVFSHFVLKPKGGALSQPCQAAPDAWFCRMRYALYVLALGIPLTLGTFSALGYDYSAQRLTVRLQTTLAVALGVMLLRAMAIRWLSIRRDRMLRNMVESADSTPGIVTAVPEDSVNADDDGNGLQPSPEELAAEVQQSDSQVRYLLRYAVVTVLLLGVYYIWSDITPALRVLDNVELWSTWVDVKEVIPGPDGDSQVVTTPTEVATTLKHVMVAGMILMLGFVLARNLPALLDVLILERMPIDKGQRYAVGMILRYVVTLAALICCCQELGFTWSSIQWLAAAMTVGLGFGLQEVFANLVSGLIILFERPVRVGDLVTVGGVTGRVTRMQIRATTVTDFDRRELIVPNKKFITEDVMNWTLSDNVNRVVIEVGVAYSSDTKRVRDLMLRVARRHPLLLREPAPSVTFDKFGESSLNFTLRCFLPSLDERLSVIHELHAEINREFRQANIEISFPQQDLHIRTVEGALFGGQAPQKEAA